MLDIKFIRENPDIVKENIKKKFQDKKLPLVDEVIELDSQRRANIQEADQLRSDRNRLSKQVGMLMGQAKKDPSKLAEAEAVKKQVTDEADRLAEELGLSPVDTVMHVLSACEGSVACIYFCINEDDMLNIMRDMRIALGSDGYGFSYDRSITRTNPHPRSFGTFPRFLELARDHRLMPLEDAVYKLTGLPADILGLKDRGTLEEGRIADITVFDPEQVRDLSEYTDSVKKPAGIRHVLVGGTFALKDGDAVTSIAYVIETYGIIYNKELLSAAGYTQDDIKGFADLKKVADDIQARKAELGVDGAFTSAGMDGSSDWRFKTHLANLPIYYEYKADGIGSTDAIKGTYLDNYKQIWDLYITDSTCDPTLLASKTGNDAVAEFVGKKAVFYQNGTWAYNDVKDLGDDNLGMLPIYIGVDGEENQGLCTGSENFWCVNNNSSDADIQATLDFLYWCVTSEAGTSAMADKMGFVIPFKKAKDSTNPLIGIANQYVADGKTSVDWCFSTMPSEEWKNGVGSALTAYAAGTGDWNGVVTAFVDGWAKEYKLANG